MFQIQPYLLLLGINPYLKEDSLKTAYNGILFIEFVKISPLSEIPIFYHHNVNSMKNPPNSLSKCPKADDVKTLYFKYFILGVKSIEGMQSFTLKNWNKEKLLILIWIVSSYENLMNKLSMDFNEFDWQTLSNLFPNILFQNLQYKWASLFKKNPTKWAKEEDDLLSNLIMKYDCQKIKWSEIAQSFNMVFAKDDLKKVKIGSDCRERYFNHLNPNLKNDPWTVKEEILLLEMSLSFKRKWANISQFLPGRTQHSIKNQFLSIMIKHLEVPRSKLLQILKRKTLEDEILECLKALKAKK